MVVKAKYASMPAAASIRLSRPDGRDVVPVERVADGVIVVAIPVMMATLGVAH
jgi:hypothetical protein